MVGEGEGVVLGDGPRAGEALDPVTVGVGGW